MKAFLASLAVLAIISIAALFGLKAVDMSAERIYSVSDTVRL